ncbi:hypothetical protein N7497_009001 [Penicillium chrysogenum]|uniref:Uncharacterized protein n=1 Tax=Penicillium chrysogenum TaxID=5076 RepID=A0ABQ8WMK3_PENCH|nr:hypothetical protein N7505_005994 [Penicillium chrysogenum]KAJ6147019.1 hypothetical protein N7497_009001 [Penicillium chrysogenum]
MKSGANFIPQAVAYNPIVEGGETPQSPANHQRARTPPETQRSTGRRGRDRNVRSANPSPEQEVNQPQNLRNTTSLKREKSDSKPSDLRRSKRKRKGERKTRVELGNTVVGFISIATRGDTDEVARHIYDLPVPPQVSRRLILYGDVCFCGSSAAVEINLEGPNVGTDDLGGDGTDSSRGGFVGSVAGPAGSSTAVSTAGAGRFCKCRRIVLFPSMFDTNHVHTHERTMEVMISTDDMWALQRLNGTVPYAAEGGHARMIKTILDRLLLLQGVSHLRGRTGFRNVM